MRTRTLFAAIALVGSAAASSQASARNDQLAGAPSYGEPIHHRSEGTEPPRGPSGDCYAKVKFGAQYAPPPTGPEYIWRKTPAPPGAPGPIWCLTVQPFPDRPVLISPERYGWIRVLCDTEATGGRIAGIQRRLTERGLYSGEADGRYDAQTGEAVKRFQEAHRIEHRGYLSYETMEALEGPPPGPPPPLLRLRHLTTFETGYLDWPGKTRF